MHSLESVRLTIQKDIGSSSDNNHLRQFNKLLVEKKKVEAGTLQFWIITGSATFSAVTLTSASLLSSNDIENDYCTTVKAPFGISQSSQLTSTSFIYSVGDSTLDITVPSFEANYTCDSVTWSYQGYFTS